jgi:phage tail sheath protein FI
MPEYLAPGVYVEEVSFRAKLIEGVATSTTGFVGPTRYGPTNGLPELVTSFPEFQRIYGGLEQLVYAGAPVHNYLAQGVRAFFDNGGRRAYIARIFRRTPMPGAPPGGFAPGADPHFASITLTSQAAAPTISAVVEARYPGLAGQVGFGLTFRIGQNVLVSARLDPADPASAPVATLRGVVPFDLVLVESGGSFPGAGIYWVDSVVDPVTTRRTWVLRDEAGGLIDFRTLPPDPAAGDRVYPVTAAVDAVWYDTEGAVQRRDLWDDVAFHPAHPRSLHRLFGPSPLDSHIQDLVVPFVFHGGSLEGPALARLLLDQIERDLDPALSLSFPTLRPHFSTRPRDADQRSFSRRLQGGSDGDRPEAEDYEGNENAGPAAKTGLRSLEDIWDVSIVAAPGHSHKANGDANVQATANALISHCERMRYRIAVLDSKNAEGIGEVRAFRAVFDSKYAALYYPWVRVLDPVTDREIDLPPSGFVAGIYARNDIERGVHKAPANEVVRGAIGFEVPLNKGHQDVLNPEHINALRYFTGRGYRVWGARTITSDPEWKYVNLRRYFAFLEQSIERGTQWAVFEPNGDELWANVRRTVDDFLFNEWKSSHLLGTRPEEAYFVRCDRTTMTPNDLDNGRMICLIGVCPLRPAEFVIFRIGQWTADRPA